jgi:hypothetical protein
MFNIVIEMSDVVLETRAVGTIVPVVPRIAIPVIRNLLYDLVETELEIAGHVA